MTFELTLIGLGLCLIGHVCVCVESEWCHFGGITAGSVNNPCKCVDRARLINNLCDKLLDALGVASLLATPAFNRPHKILEM